MYEINAKEIALSNYDRRWQRVGRRSDEDFSKVVTGLPSQEGRCPSPHMNDNCTQNPIFRYTILDPSLTIEVIIIKLESK